MASKTVTRSVTVNSATRCHTLSKEGYSGFQMTGMIKEFFGGLKFSILGNLASSFLGGLVYMQVGTFLGIKTNWRFLVVPVYPAANTNIQFLIYFLCFIIYFFLENVMDFQAREFGMGFFLMLIFCPGIFFLGGGG